VAIVPVAVPWAETGSFGGLTVNAGDALPWQCIDGESQTKGAG